MLEEIALYRQEREGAASPPRVVDLSRVIVMVPNGSGSQRIAAKIVEIEQVRAARRKLRRGNPGGRKVGPVEKAIRSALATRRSLREVSVRTEGERVSLGNVPLAALADLAATLTKKKLEG